jgi:S-adenosylmethionine decarboxylase
MENDSTVEQNKQQQQVPADSPYLGRHIIAEFFQADFDALNKGPELEEAMKQAALAAGATILSSHQHTFEPHGVSSVVII